MKIISKRSLEFLKIIAPTRAAVSLPSDPSLAVFIVEEDRKFRYYVGSCTVRRELMGRTVECPYLDLIEVPLSSSVLNLEEANMLALSWLRAGCPSLGEHINHEGLDRLSLRIATGDWIPTIFDLAWQQLLLDRLADGGVWGIPGGLMLVRKEAAERVSLVLADLTPLLDQENGDGHVKVVEKYRDRTIEVFHCLGYATTGISANDSDAIIMMSKSQQE